jgi:DUF4097 and DUF4098 domain-containing protein YvlB
LNIQLEGESTNEKNKIIRRIHEEKMKTKTILGKLFVTFLIMALTASCGMFLRPTVEKLETGPIQTTEINIPLTADSSDMSMEVEFMSGKLKISPGAVDSLVSGFATFNAEALKPMVFENKGFYTIQQGNQEYEGFPLFPKDVTNFWDIKLADIPLHLNIEAGAYTGEIELGGLSLKELYINEIGSDINLAFSEPNRVEMKSFKYMTGGSTMVLEGLANANFSQMEFDSGAGDYTLSFDGDLKRDAKVLIKTGASTLTIIVPKTTNAVLVFDGGMTSINNSGWNKNENVFSISGNGPTLTINVEMGLGTLNLETD